MHFCFLFKLWLKIASLKKHSEFPEAANPQPFASHKNSSEHCLFLNASIVLSRPECIPIGQSVNFNFRLDSHWLWISHSLSEPWIMLVCHLMGYNN